MEMKPQSFDDVPTGPSRELLDHRAGEKAEQSKLKQDLLDFIDEEAHMVKGLASQSKKDLAREVVHLRGLVKTIKKATQSVQPGAATFGHAEAFRVMQYIQTNEAQGEAPEVITVWNSRDGVTPFIVHIGGKSYQHNVQAMKGPVFDLPPEATHKWVTRTDAETLTAWRRTLDKAVEQGKLDPDKAELQRDNLEAAVSWNYRIGLVSVSSGRFTDEEVLSNA